MNQNLSERQNINASSLVYPCSLK